MAKKKKKSEGVSPLAMTIGVMIFIAWFFWAVAASACLGAVVDPGLTEGAGGESLWFGISGFVTFFGNSFRFDQLPRVVAFVFQERIGILWLFLMFEAAALGFGLWVRSLEAEFQAKTEKRKHRRISKSSRLGEDDVEE